MKMKTILWIFALAMVAMLWSCEGKRVEAVRADRPDTLVLAAGPDSLVAQIGAASTADRLQLVLKFQNSYPDTIVVALPDELKPKKGEKDDAPVGFVAGQMVAATVSREESGEYVLHAITNVTDVYQKVCESYAGTWTTTDSVPLRIHVVAGGKVTLENAPKLRYSAWQFFNSKFSGILLKTGTGVCDTAWVADGKLTIYCHQGNTRQKMVLERGSKPKADRAKSEEE